MYLGLVKQKAIIWYWADRGRPFHEDIESIQFEVDVLLHRVECNSPAKHVESEPTDPNEVVWIRYIDHCDHCDYEYGDDELHAKCYAQKAAHERRVQAMVYEQVNECS